MPEDKDRMAATDIASMAHAALQAHTLEEQEALLWKIDRRITSWRLEKLFSRAAVASMLKGG